MEKISDEQKQDSQNTCSAHSTKVLLVAANVGSLFEDPNRLLQPWINEFISKISQLRPEFIAIHLQEVGGKTYEKSMECVQQFIKNLCEADGLRNYTCIQIFMDEDFRSAEHFTALGNLYFIHEELSEVKIWNFLNRTWEVSHGKNIFSGNIETIATKEKSKFPQHFFPECKWSRKGFMRTRWDINGTVLDLVNIHLFHDASNLAACEEFPSVYCKTRRRALVHTLERFHLDNKNGLVPFFIFGDFNFRCDAEGVIKELTENLTAHRVQSAKHDSTKVLYRNSKGNNVLTLAKKEFLHADHQLKFKETWLKKHDREIEPLQKILFEYPIEFSPTYPYEEDPEMPTDYMSTRCPAWCDRILMSLTAKEIVEDESGSGIKENPYNIIGENVCMGDHKPIYLHFKLKPNQGTNRSCKCYSNSGAKANKSASHIKLASIERANGTDFDIHCPYRSHVYNDILIECSKLNELPFNSCKNTNDEYSYAQLLKEHNELPPSNDSSQINGSVLKELNHPTVSINIFDSDNINVCLCSQMTEINSDLDDIDGTLCQHCLNIIKKQPQRHRCTLISKRLVLSNDIIVNRIDSQYLNTHLDYTKEQHDPYTPESTESHSPYPELNSASTTSSNIQSNLDRHSDIMKHHLRDISPEKVQVHSNDSPPLKGQNFQDNVLDSDEIRQRGMVTPGQLKSRLEDLQRSSLNNLNNANCGDDVDNVEKRQTKTSFKKHKKWCCLSGCCNIC